MLVQLRKCRRSLISVVMVPMLLVLNPSVVSCAWATPVFIMLRRRNDIPLFVLNCPACGPLMLRKSVVSWPMRLGVRLWVCLRLTVRLSMASARLQTLPRCLRLLILCMSVVILGTMCLVTFACIKRLSLGCGVLASSSPASLLCMCLVDMTLTCLVTVVTVLIILDVGMNFNRDVNWVVCTTCSGLLLNDILGGDGACRMLDVRLLRFLCGLLNVLAIIDSVTVPMAKLCWVRLLVTCDLNLMAGPCEVGLQSLVWQAAILMMVLLLVLVSDVLTALKVWLTL